MAAEPLEVSSAQPRSRIYVNGCHGRGGLRGAGLPSVGLGGYGVGDFNFPLASTSAELAAGSGARTRPG